MKKLLLSVLIASSVTTSAFAQSEKATVIMTDKKMSDAVIVVNILCDSAIDISKFEEPNKDISLNFDNLACPKIVKLMEDFGQQTK